MKVLVAYYSETGNTEKVARAISENVSKNHQVHLKRVSEIAPDSLSNYGFVFLGSACHDSDLATPAKRLLRNIPDSPKFKLAGFFTHATTLPKGSQTRQTLLFKKWAGKCVESFQQITEKKQIDFQGYFNCQGAPVPPILDFIKRKILSPDEWEEYEREVMKHPTPEDLQKAKEFAKRILSQLKE